MLLGVVLNVAFFGTSGLLTSVAGLLVVMLLLVPPFALGGIGGGDVKMMAAVGALLGPRAGLIALGAGLLLGGVIMAVHLARRQRLRETVGRVGAMAFAACSARTLEPLRVSTTAPGAITLPYSVPLALGVVGALLLRRSIGAW